MNGFGKMSSTVSPRMRRSARICASRLCFLMAGRSSLPTICACENRSGASSVLLSGTAARSSFAIAGSFPVAGCPCKRTAILQSAIVFYVADGLEVPAGAVANLDFQALGHVSVFLVQVVVGDVDGAGELVILASENRLAGRDDFQVIRRLYLDRDHILHIPSCA